MISLFWFPLCIFHLLNFPLTACDSSSPPAILPYSNSIFPLFPFLLLFIFLIRILCFLFDFFLPSINFSRFLLLPRPDIIASPSRFLPPFPPLHRLRFLFYSILTLSLNLRFFTCDSFSLPAIPFYLLPFKTITMPENPSTFLNFYSIYPRFILSIRFIFHPFERSIAWKNLENAKNSPEIMQFDNPNPRQNPMILCFTT